MAHTLPEVKIDQFEGPYDLLVELAKKQRVDISRISLESLTDSFIEYMEQHTLPPETIASFIVVASTLLLIKARQILPQLKTEEEEEIANLEEHLQLYERYRKAAERVGELWDTHRLLPAHFFGEGEVVTYQNFSEMQTITPQELADMLKAKIQQIPLPQPKAHLTSRRGRSLSELFTLFKERLAQVAKITFQDTVQGATAQEQAASFLAVLEMARNQEVRLEQSEAFGTLVIHKT